MQYGDATFYLACLAVAELVLTLCTLVSGSGRRFLRTHPWQFQIIVLLLTAASLYGSDSNKGGQKPPPTPQPTLQRIYFHRDEAGVMRAFSVFVDAVSGQSVTNEARVVTQ